MVNGEWEERETQDSQLFMTDNLKQLTQRVRYPEISSPSFSYMVLMEESENVILMVTTPSPLEANHLGICSA